MVHRVKTDANGRYFSSFYASGTLVVDPYFPPGDPYPATVFEVYRSYMSDWSQTAFMEAKQVLHTDPVQWTFEALWAGPWNVYLGQESCGY